MDGDKTSVFHDVDGSVSEYPGSYLIKEDNWLIKHPDCIDVPDWRGSICSGHYAQVKWLTLQFCNHFILILILLALYILTFRNWLSSGCPGLNCMCEQVVLKVTILGFCSDALAFTVNWNKFYLKSCENSTSINRLIFPNVLVSG